MASPEEELQKFRSLTGLGQTNAQNAPPPVTAQGVADPAAEMERFRTLTAMPLSQNAVNQVRGVEAVPALSLTELEGRRTPEGELIPISNEGLGARYWRVAQQRGPEAQVAVLEKMYPNSKPRILQNGAITVELMDSATGKPKDVIVNPVGIESHDLVDLAAQMPEIAAGVATAIATRGTGPLKTIAQMVLSSLATAGVGGARDVVSRTTEGIDANLSEITKARSGDAALDMFLQTGMLGAGKAFRALSPFAKEIKPQTLEFDLQSGQQFFKNVFGEDFPLTPAEITGSPALRAVEAAETPQPGARTVMQRLRERREETVRRIIDRATGKLTPEETIGEESILTLSKANAPLEGALQDALNAAEFKGTVKVKRLLNEASGMQGGGRISPSMAGAKTLEEFESKLAQAEAKVDEAYAAVNALPGGTGDVLNGDAAARAAAEIRKELPKVRRGGEEAVLTSGVPEGLMKALTDLESLAGGKVSLQTLTNMKRAAYDEIAKTEAVPGVKERWFNKIAKAYETGIQKGIDETGDPALKQALTNAKEVYKKELLPFDRPGLKEMARGEFDAGRLSPEQITNRLFEGPKAIENFKMLKETLGADSSAFRVLKRSWMDTQLADVSDPITGSINAEAFAQKLHKLNVDRPELAKEMFGNKFPELMGELRFLTAYKNISKLDGTEIRALMNLPNPSKADLEAVLRMQKNRDTAYSNSILKDIGDGVAPNIKPTEFVKRITNANTPTPEVEEVLTKLADQNPEAREAIATATFYRLLDDASVVGADTASRSMGSGALNISPTKLAKAIGREGSPERRRFELLMGEGGAPVTPGDPGPGRMEVLENLVKLLAPSEVKTQAAAAAGSLAGGQEVLRVTRGPFQYASNFAKKFALATLYTTELGTKLISNRVFSPGETAALANTLIASEPFVRRVTETLGDDLAGPMINELKTSIDRYVNELMESPSGRQRAEIGKFARGEQASVRIQPTR